MKNKMMNLAMSLVLVSSQTLQASAMDVKPKSGNVSIQVQVDTSGKHVKFSKCIGEDCSQKLAGGKWFSIKKLQSQRAQEQFEVAGAVVGDIAVIAAMATGFFYGGLALGAAVGTGDAILVTSLGGATIGAGVGGVGGIAVSTMVDALNPREQYKQSETLVDEVIQDKLVILETDEDVLKFAERLETVLEKM